MGARSGHRRRQGAARFPACRQGGRLWRADAGDEFAAGDRLPEGRPRRIGIGPAALMAYVESHALVSRPEFGRWTACAAVVVAAHAVLALAIASRSDDVDLEAGAPVVTIELAPLSVAPPAPVSELAP